MFVSLPLMAFSPLGELQVVLWEVFHTKAFSVGI